MRWTHVYTVCSVIACNDIVCSGRVGKGEFVALQNQLQFSALNLVVKRHCSSNIPLTHAEPVKCMYKHSSFDHQMSGSFCM